AVVAPAAAALAAVTPARVVGTVAPVAAGRAPALGAPAAPTPLAAAGVAAAALAQTAAAGALLLAPAASHCPIRYASTRPGRPRASFPAWRPSQLPWRQVAPADLLQ